MAGSETPGQRPPEMRGICPMCLHPYTPAGPRQLWGEQICVRCFREVLERENTERFEQQFGDFRRRIWHALLLLGWIVVIALVAAHYA